MPDSSCIVRAPGKLMIAGEYAVLERGHRAVVAAVNRYVTASIGPDFQNRLFLPQLGLEEIVWEAVDGGIKFSVSDSRLSFLGSSLSVVLGFLEEKSVKPRPFQLKLESELDDASTGRKYGLGSSAAVVAAVVSAVLHFHMEGEEKPSLEDIFKLSALAHIRTQGNGSGADIASAVYGGWLEYSAFNGEWLLKELEKGEGIGAIVDKPWPDLTIETLTPPPRLYLAVGWTGESASTSSMVRRVHRFREQSPKEYAEFLQESSSSVARLIKGFKNGDCIEVIEGLKQNRESLRRLGESADIPIETDGLKTLCDLADYFGGGKPSGAGGGDCGIALLTGKSEVQELHRAWEKAGIIPLDLEVSEKGVHIAL